MSALALGAAFIALLALRQVLIPSDIPGITLLDRLLGIEIVLLVAIAVANLPHRNRAPAPAEPGSHPQDRQDHAPAPGEPGSPPRSLKATEGPTSNHENAEQKSDGDNDGVKKTRRTSRTRKHRQP